MISAMPSPKKSSTSESPRAKKPSEPCAECGSTTNTIAGERFLTVEAEWREQVLCQLCAAKYGPTQYRSP